MDISQPDSDLMVHYRPKMAHFRSESAYEGLEKLHVSEMAHFKFCSHRLFAYKTLCHRLFACQMQLHGVWPTSYGVFGPQGPMSTKGVAHPPPLLMPPPVPHADTSIVTFYAI